MKTRSLLWLLAAVILGCNPPPARKDPLAGLGGGQGGAASALKKLSAGLILKPSGPSVSDDEREMFDRVLDVFGNWFKEARPAESVAHAGELAVDVIGLVEIQSSIPATAIGTATVQVQVSLLSSDQQPIDKLQAQGVQGTKLMLVREDLKNRAQSFAAEQLDKALTGSTKLAEFSRTAVPQAMANRRVAAAAVPTASSTAEPLPALHASALVMELKATHGVPARVSQLLTKRILAKLDDVEGLKTVSPEDLQLILSVEKQKDALGCDDVKCMAEVGGALGTDYVIYGQLGIVGSQYSLNLTAIDTKNNIAAARVSVSVAANEDALMQSVPGVVASLLTKITRGASKAH